MLAAAVVDLDTLAEKLRLLGDPTRLRIIDALLDGERCNCELGDSVGVRANLVSHHLRALERAGLVSARRDAVDARWVHYSIVPSELKALLLTLQNRLAPRRRAVTPARRPGARGG